MLKQTVSFLTSAIAQNGPISVFWAAIIEQIISPIPSVLIPMSAGFFLIPKNLPFLKTLIFICQKVALPYSLGATLGTSVLFLGSFYGGSLLIERFGKYFGLSLKGIDKFRKKFTRGVKDEIVIFLLVALPATPISLVATSCGIIRIPAQEFYPLMLGGTFVRAVFLAFLGCQVGETYELISSGLNRVETILSILVLTAAFAFLGFLYLKRAKILKD